MPRQATFGVTLTRTLGAGDLVRTAGIMGTRSPAPHPTLAGTRAGHVSRMAAITECASRSQTPRTPEQIGYALPTADGNLLLEQVFRARQWNDQGGILE